ncbi:MAG: FAD-dependent oxidoreductase [Desulfobulbaceae bacterium]|nr:FAD-dependent oxidoreductase [Desulfobulbaceae bacterium]
MNVVIIGAVALGPKTACRIKRLNPEINVTMIDRDSIVSYGGCGIPYFISGDVSEATQLQTTSFHMVRDEKFFNKAKDVEVLTRTEAVSINRKQKTVLIRNLDTEQERELPYDKLVLATGSTPNRLTIPGSTLKNVFTVANIHDATHIRELIAKGKVSKPVVIGAGAIGLEMVEAFSDLWGLDTTLIEVQEQLLPGSISPNMSKMVKQHLIEKNVEKVFLKECVQEFGGEGQVEWIKTDKRTIDADLVVMAVGVRPNTQLAKDADLSISKNGAIKVNKQFQTTDSNIYAGGDCIENLHLVTGKPVYFPSGSLANRHGRMIGSNVLGATEEFPGVVTTFILKMFDLAIAATGISLDQAQRAGYDVFSTFVVQGDRAHFFPGMDLMYLEMVVEKESGRVFGVQGISGNGDALSARINAIGTLLQRKTFIKDISNLELAYAPPFSAAMDIVNALGNTAENIIAGKNRVMDIDQFEAVFGGPADQNYLFLDVRGPANAKPFVEAYPGLWLNIPQDELRDRIDEVPRDKNLVLICNSGVRSYEAQITLDLMGISTTKNLQGGVAAIKKSGMKLV